MDEEKLTGSYYTPESVVRFMVDYLGRNQQDFSYVLEPSAGDGRFIKALQQTAGQIDAIELYEDKIKALQAAYPSPAVHIEQADFIGYALKSAKRYSLVIGNPPYINPKAMGKEDISQARQLCKEEARMMRLPRALAGVTGSDRTRMPHRLLAMGSSREKMAAVVALR